MDWLYKLIDDSLLKMSKSEISMMTPGEIPEKMQDTSIRNMNDWSGWKPINSVIEDSDIEKFEREIGYSLPKSYCEYLKYKHFYRLSIKDKCVNLPNLLPDRNLTFLREYVSDYLEPELIIGRGYIYFADFEDYGLLCFDTNVKAVNNEYPIVFIDHEDLDDIHLYSKSFKKLMEADKNFGNRFIDYLNAFHN